MIKVSAVPDDRHVIEAPVRLFDSQEALHVAFNAGELDRDVICVVRWQGPQANGMPELHKLTPPLAVLQGKGFKVALVTDGRMSGALAQGLVVGRSMGGVGGLQDALVFATKRLQADRLQRYVTVMWCASTH